MFILDGRQAFYQWDLEQKITSEKFKVGDQIHFTNGEQSTALVLIAYELNGQIVVDVPNILLQSDIPITVYRYIKTPEDSHTIEQQDFYVIPRAKPDDYIYTPTEYHTVEKAVEEALTIAKENGDFKGDKGEKGDAGVVKFIPVAELPNENIDESAIYLVPSNDTQNNNTFDEYLYIDGAWEKIGSAAVEVNLDEYVKNTDYATKDNAGVVKVLNYDSGLIMEANGRLKICSANSNNIRAKTHEYKPITPNTLDLAVKVGLTTNTETLTDEEKAAACKWIGAKGKLETINTLTTTEDTKVLKIDTDTFGNAFELEEIYVVVEMPKSNVKNNFNFYLADGTTYYTACNNETTNKMRFIVSWEREKCFTIESYRYGTEFATKKDSAPLEDVVVNQFRIQTFDSEGGVPTGTKITVKGIRK